MVPVFSGGPPHLRIEVIRRSIVKSYVLGIQIPSAFLRALKRWHRWGGSRAYRRTVPEPEKGWSLGLFERWPLSLPKGGH